MVKKRISLIKLLFSTLIVISMFGCVSSPNGTIYGVSGEQIVPPNMVLCLAIPNDASFEGYTYINSGQRVANKVNSSLSDYYSIIPLGYNENIVSQCREIESEFMIYPEIVHYEDRATGWSGRPDIIEVKTTLTNLKTLEKSSFIYSAKSNMVASGLFEWGNAAPCSLLGQKYKSQVLSLVKGNAPNTYQAPGRQE